MHNTPIIIRTYASFEVDNKIDNFRVGKKANVFYEQNLVCYGFCTVSEWNDALRSSFIQSLLGYDRVDWFVDEVIKLDKHMNFFFENTKKEIIMTKEDEEVFAKK